MFVAIDVNDAVRDLMRLARRSIEGALERQGKAPRLTWVAPDAAHVTVRFIGEVDEATAARLIEEMRGDIDQHPFDVAWQGLGLFPSPRAPRAIWIGELGAATALAALAERVQTRIDPLIGQLEPRPFRAHLTVARVRDRAAGIDWRRVLDAGVVGPVVSSVDHVTLYRSTLSSQGPTYTAMARASLV